MDFSSDLLSRKSEFSILWFYGCNSGNVPKKKLLELDMFRLLELVWIHREVIEYEQWTILIKGFLIIMSSRFENTFKELKDVLKDVKLKVKPTLTVYEQNIQEIENRRNEDRHIAEDARITEDYDVLTYSEPPLFIEEELTQQEKRRRKKKITLPTPAELPFLIYQEFEFLNAPPLIDDGFGGDLTEIGTSINFDEYFALPESDAEQSFDQQSFEPSVRQPIVQQPVQQPFEPSVQPIVQQPAQQPFDDFDFEIDDQYIDDSNYDLPDLELNIQEPIEESIEQQIEQQVPQPNVQYIDPDIIDDLPEMEQNIQSVLEYIEQSVQEELQQEYGHQEPIDVWNVSDVDLSWRGNLFTPEKSTVGQETRSRESFLIDPNRATASRSDRLIFDPSNPSNIERDEEESGIELLPYDPEQNRLPNRRNNEVIVDTYMLQEYIFPENQERIDLQNRKTTRKYSVQDEKFVPAHILFNRTVIPNSIIPFNYRTQPRDRDDLPEAALPSAHEQPDHEQPDYEQPDYEQPDYEPLDYEPSDFGDEIGDPVDRIVRNLLNEMVQKVSIENLRPQRSSDSSNLRSIIKLDPQRASTSTRPDFSNFDQINLQSDYTSGTSTKKRKSVRFDISTDSYRADDEAPSASSAGDTAGQFTQTLPVLSDFSFTFINTILDELDDNDGQITFSVLARNLKRKDAAKLFSDLLVLKMKREIEMFQEDIMQWTEILITKI